MVKINNISNSLMSNPLTHIILVLFLLVIILGVIRIFSPTFSVGAKVGGHFGTLSGSVNVEGFDGHEGSGNMANSSDMDASGDMGDSTDMAANMGTDSPVETPGDMEEMEGMESFQNYYM